MTNSTRENLSSLYNEFIKDNRDYIKNNTDEFQCMLAIVDGDKGFLNETSYVALTKASLDAFYGAEDLQGISLCDIAYGLARACYDYDGIDILITKIQPNEVVDAIVNDNFEPYLSKYILSEKEQEM